MKTNDPIERNECRWKLYQSKLSTHVEPRSVGTRRRNRERKKFHPEIGHQTNSFIIMQILIINHAGSTCKIHDPLPVNV